MRKHARRLPTVAACARPGGRFQPWAAGGVVAGVAAGGAVLWVVRSRRRSLETPARDTSDPAGTSVEQIREACDWDCDAVVPFVLQDSGSNGLETEWPVLHAELIDLESRTDAAATGCGSVETRRALDRTSQALIALRTALEAHVRLRLGPVDASQTSLLEAAASTVAVRRDDLRSVAEALPHHDE